MKKRFSRLGERLTFPGRVTDGNTVIACRGVPNVDVSLLTVAPAVNEIEENAVIGSPFGVNATQTAVNRHGGGSRLPTCLDVMADTKPLRRNASTEAVLDSV